MKLRYKFANQVVGVFVIVAVALTVTLIILMGANQRWFRRNYEYYARFDTAKDLSVGMAITFRGFTIGRVTDIELTQENEVHVSFTVQEEYIDKVTRDSLIQVASSPLGGGEILFHQGREQTAPLPEGTEIPIYSSKQGLRLREENRAIVLRDADPIGQALSQLDPILANVDRVLLNVAGLTEEIELTLRGQTSGPVGDVLVGLERSAAEVQRTIVRVNDVIADTAVRVDAVLARAETIASNLEETSVALRDPTGLVPTLLDPKGSVATLLDDDNRLYEQVQTIVGSLQESIDGLRASIAEISEFTGYLNTAQPQISSLLEEGRQTLDSGQDVLESLRNNPLLRGGIPDAREQPTTFRSVRDEEF
jgi:phospholipid/cholesterol/gamma-HCH transport system substrate-binding protein